MVDINMFFNIALGLLLLAGAIKAGIEFYKLSKEKKLEMVSEWLLLAVVQAEKELGDGTGQIKLRYVYDLFLAKFKYFAMLISFEQFSSMVDIALDKMKAMLQDNNQLKQYVGKGQN